LSKSEVIMAETEDPRPSFPLPPPLLRERVSGTSDEKWFLESGERTLNDWSRALLAIGVKLESVETVLDFGCGCGRVLRWLAAKKKSEQRLIGADVDGEAISWIAENLPEVQAI
jgi:predicted RNA methylase